MKVTLRSATNIDYIIRRGYAGDAIWDQFVDDSKTTLLIVRTSELVAWLRQEYCRVAKVTPDVSLEELGAVTSICGEIYEILRNLAKVTTEYVYLTNKM